jgi:hypothetical protein
VQPTYAKSIEVSKRVRFDIDRDVIRARELDFSQKFLPDGLSKLRELPFLGAAEKRLFSQVQGRTYANMFGLVERFIGPKMLQASADHWLGDQTAFEALVRFTDEELKHQEMFRRMEALSAPGMAPGYIFLPQPNDVAKVVLGKHSWAVLALICHIELFVLAHYRKAIEPAGERDAAVDDLIALVGAVDGIVQMQAQADSTYFLSVCGRSFGAAEALAIGRTMLGAYRWQYIVSGVQEPRFQQILGAMVSEAQMQRIGTALAPILGGA